jgi:hypothetical protein
MHRLYLTLVILAAAVGCGGTPVDPPVNTTDAGNQLRAALDAWKAGEPHEGLAGKTPPIIFPEPLWKDGARLLAYEMGEVGLNGRQGRCAVKLSLRFKDGKSSERKIGYQIDTVPQVVIIREALGP